MQTIRFLKTQNLAPVMAWEDGITGIQTIQHTHPQTHPHTHSHKDTLTHTLTHKHTHTHTHKDKRIHLPQSWPRKMASLAFTLSSRRQRVWQVAL
jgi:hypothetical protein